MDISALQLRIIELDSQLSVEAKRHAEAYAALLAARGECLTQINNVKSGLDEKKLLLAEHVIYARVFGAGEGEKSWAVQAAITDILNGCGRIRNEYFGTKNYDRFYSQGLICEYGRGPRHGAVNFSIGLKREPRKRLLSGGVLTSDEIEAAVYYLTFLRVIEAARVAT